MRNILPENTSENWERIRCDDFYGNDREEVLTVARQVASEPMPQLDYEKFMLFYTVGDRTEYERVYFERRRRLNALAFAARIEADGNTEMLSALSNAVWQICNEDSWALPAHIKSPNSTEERRQWLDLFATETGFALSEISLLLCDRLSGEVTERIEYEVRNRIVLPYLAHKRNYFWEKARNNWAAVCACGIGMCLLRFGSDEEVEAAMPRLLATVDCFLDGFGTDGCCREGFSYWNYGFGFFLMFAEALYSVSGGKTDLLSDARAKRAALFPQRVNLGRHAGVSFADSADGFSVNPGILHRIFRRVPGVELPGAEYYEPVFNDCYRFGLFIRRFLWSEPALSSASLPVGNYFYSEAGWMICRRTGFSFAAKGGRNDEPHNHNDIGSFIFVKNGAQTFCDFGNSAYDKEYFRAETRYGYLVCRSMGHSVPIIGGSEQCAGKDFFATVTEQSDGILAIDITTAYPRGIGLISATRRFECKDDCVCITDCFVFEDGVPPLVTERFVSNTPPRLENGAVTVGEAVLSFDAEALGVTVSEDNYPAHSISDGCPLHTAYFADISPRRAENRMTFEFVIK